MPSEKEIKAADRELAAMSIHDLHNDLRRRLLAERVLVAAEKEQEVEVRVREIADWIERDRREPDKLLCHVASLRRVALHRELASSRLSAAEKEREGHRADCYWLRSTPVVDGDEADRGQNLAEQPGEETK